MKLSHASERNIEPVFEESGQIRQNSTFSKVPTVIQVQFKLQKQKDFFSLIHGFFNHNRTRLRSNFWGTFDAQCRSTDGVGAVVPT